MALVKLSHGFSASFEPLPRHMQPVSRPYAGQKRAATPRTFPAPGVLSPSSVKTFLPESLKIAFQDRWGPCFFNPSVEKGKSLLILPAKPRCSALSGASGSPVINLEMSGISICRLAWWVHWKGRGEKFSGERYGEEETYGRIAAYSGSQR